MRNFRSTLGLTRWWAAGWRRLVLTLLFAGGIGPAPAQRFDIRPRPDSVTAAQRLLVRADTLLYTQPDTALALARRAEALARAARNPEDQGGAWNTIGAIHYTRDQYQSALQAYKRALQCFKQNGSLEQQSLVLGNLGALSLTMNLPEAGYGYFERQLRLMLTLRPDSAGTSVALLGTGAALLELNRLPEALARFQIYRRRARLAGVPTGEGKALGYIAQVFLKQQRFREALAALEQARRLVPVGADGPVFEVDVLRNFGDAYRGLGQWARAEASYQTMLRQPDINQIDQQAAFEALTDVQERAGDFRAAYRSLRRVQNLNDSLADHQTAQQVQELETRYRTRDLQRANQIQQLTISRKNQLAVFGFGAAGLALLAAGALGLLFRQRTRANHRLAAANAEISRTVAEKEELLLEKEGLLAEKETLIQEVHHRVKNNLQLVSGLLGWQAETDAAAAPALHQSRARLHSMALIHEHLYRADDLTRVRLDEYLGQLLTTLATAHATPQQPIHLTTHLAPLAVEAKDAIPLGLITNELVLNAYKHAFRGRAAGHLYVTLAGTAGGEAFQLTVADDGVGVRAPAAPPAAPSLGMQLVRMLARQLKADLKTEPAPEGGTQFVLTRGELVRSD